MLAGRELLCSKCPVVWVMDLDVRVLSGDGMRALLCSLHMIVTDESALGLILGNC